MTTFYEVFGTDKDAEKSGIWLDYGEAGQIKIARAGGGNKSYTQALQKMVKEHRHQMDTDTMADAVADKLTLAIFVNHVLLDWKGVKGPDGKVLTFGDKNAVKLLKDLPDLYTDLQAQSRKISNFRAEAIEADAKN